MTTADEQSTLDARARRFAVPPENRIDEGQQLDLITFVLSGERYGIETRFVREVSRLTAYAVVPGAPEFVVGVTNRRGDVLMIVDLRRLLGLEVRGVADLSRLLVLGGEAPDLGVLADEVAQIVTVSNRDLQEAPGSVKGIGRHYLRGVTRDALIVLAGDTVLADRRLHLEETSES